MSKVKQLYGDHFDLADSPNDSCDDEKGRSVPPPGRHENLRRHMPHRPAAHAVIMFYIRQFSVCRTGAQSQSG